MTTCNLALPLKKIAMLVLLVSSSIAAGTIGVGANLRTEGVDSERSDQSKSVGPNGVAIGDAGSVGEKKRLMTEADSIGMSLIAGPNSDRSYANALTRDFASFSPDGRLF